MIQRYRIDQEGYITEDKHGDLCMWIDADDEIAKLEEIITELKNDLEDQVAYSGRLEAKILQSVNEVRGWSE